MCFFFKTVHTQATASLHATTGMPLWAFDNAQATGKNTRSFNLLDQNKTCFVTYMSQGAEGVAATVTTNDFLGYLHGDRELFLLQRIRLESLGNEHKSANNLLPVSQNFNMCYCRKRSSSGYIILTCVIFMVHAHVECSRQESNLVDLCVVIKRSRLSSDLFWTLKNG